MTLARLRGENLSYGKAGAYGMTLTGNAEMRRRVAPMAISVSGSLPPSRGAEASGNVSLVLTPLLSSYPHEGTLRPVALTCSGTLSGVKG
jgi:hypothetical protein